MELKLLEDGDMVALAFKVVNDSHRGRLVYFRVFSGSLKRRSALHNATKRRKEQPSKLLRIFADHVVETERAGAGDIIAAVSISDILLVVGDIHENPGGTAVGEKLTLPWMSFGIVAGWIEVYRDR